MKQQIAIMFALSAGAACPASADVEYKLSVDALATQPGTEVGELVGFEFDDRTWAVKGVEESDRPLPHPSWSETQTHAPRFRCEPAGGCHTSYLVQQPYRPNWLDEVAWPRTRQWFHRHEQMEFNFGGIVMTR
jgi:hypothetical protein